MDLSPLLRPARLATLLAAGTLGACATPAAAELLTYVDGAPRNVWAENADGGLRRQVTSDADDSRQYSFPSANDAGEYAMLLGDRQTGNPAIVFLAGTSRTVNLMPAWGLGVTTTFGMRIAPGSRLVAYVFGRFHGAGQSVAGNVVPADGPGSPTGPGPGFPRMRGATWHGDKLVWTNLEAIFYGTGGETTSWLNPASSGEVSRDGSRLLATLPGAPKRLVYQALKGAMPGQPDDATGGCYVPYTGELGDVALSPSGSWVAFRDDAGLHVAQVAIPPGAEESCTLSQARLVSATADDPAFSNATLTPAPTPGGGGDPTPPGGGGGGTPPGGGGGKPPTTRTGPRATVARSTLKGALRNGLKVQLRGLPRGRTTVTAKLGRKLLASARVKVPASGRASLRLRFSKAGRRALRGRRSATIVVTAGTARVRVRLK